MKYRWVEEQKTITNCLGSLVGPETLLKNNNDICPIKTMLA